MQQLSGAWADALGWAAVLAGLAVFACFIVLIDRRRHARGANVAATLDRGREWELVVRRATQDLWRGPELAALQADALVKIESAEHAYNRLVVDCARLCTISELSAAPTFEPASELARETERPPERQPLAA